MEKNQLLAIMVIILVVVGAGLAFIMLSRPVAEPIYNPQEEQDTGDSYVIAEGDFEAIDVFIGYLSDASVVYGAFAHITVSDMKYYEMNNWPNNYDYTFRNRICFRASVYYANNTVSDPYETIFIIGYEYTFYVYDILMTVFFYD